VRRILLALAVVLILSLNVAYSSPSRRKVVVAAPVDKIYTLAPLAKRGVVPLPKECGEALRSYTKFENAYLIDVNSSLDGLLRLKEMGYVFEEAVVVREGEDVLGSALAASSMGIPLFIIGENFTDFIDSLTKVGIRRIYAPGEIGILQNISLLRLPQYFPRNERRVVVGFRGDSLALLAAIYAGLTESKFVVVGYPDELKNKFRGEVSTVVYVISFENLSSWGFAELYRPVIEAKGDKYMLINVGVITGSTETCAWSLAMRSAWYLYNRPEPVNSLIVYMDDSKLLAEKVARCLRREGVRIRALEYKASGGGNLTSVRLREELERTSGIVYVNLHGNPYCMATRTTGPCLIGYWNMPMIGPRTIVVTLSCSTCDLEEVRRGKYSVALAYLSKGALAYIGARRIEYSGDLETSTAYPEFIVQALMDGWSLGEAVRVVNNFHIRQYKKVEPWVAAYTCLIGDPDLVVSEKEEPSCKAEIRGDTIRVEITRETCCAFTQIPVDFSLEEVKFEKKRPDIYIRVFITQEGGTKILNLYLTRKISKELGDLAPGEVFEIKVIRKMGLETSILIGLAITLGLIALGYILRKKG